MGYIQFVLCLLAIIALLAIITLIVGSVLHMIEQEHYDQKQ